MFHFCVDNSILVVKFRRMLELIEYNVGGLFEFNLVGKEIQTGFVSHSDLFRA